MEGHGNVASLSKLTRDRQKGGLSSFSVTFHTPEANSGTIDLLVKTQVAGVLVPNQISLLHVPVRGKPGHHEFVISGENHDEIKAAHAYMSKQK